MNDLSVSLRELCKEVDTGYNDLLATSDFVGSLYNTKYSLENLCNIVNKSDYISPIAIRLMKVNLNSVNRRNGLAEVRDSVYSLESYNDIPQHLLKRKLVVSIEEGFFDKITQTVTSIWRKVTNFFNETFNKVFNIKDQLAENATELMKRIKKLHLDAVPYPIDDNASGLTIQQFIDFMVKNYFSSSTPILKFGPDAFILFIKELEDIKSEYESLKEDIERIKKTENKESLSEKDKETMDNVNKIFDQHIRNAFAILKEKVNTRINEDMKELLRNAISAKIDVKKSSDSKVKENEEELKELDNRVKEVHEEIKEGKVEKLPELADMAVKICTFNPKVKGNNWEDLYRLAYAVKDNKVDKPKEMVPAQKLVDEMLPLFIDQTKAKQLFDFYIKVDGIIAKYVKSVMQAGGNILKTIESFVKEAESKSGNDKKENK